MRKIYLLLIFQVIVSAAFSQTLSGVRIYINPGHGGFDSDDRNVKVKSYGVGKDADFWESQSNLDKGLQLFDLLKRAGATTFISRTTNTTEDDLPLSQIVRMANEADADFMLSIHSNAGGKANYILQLYAGVDPGDTHIYPTPTPCSDEGRVITTLIAENQYTNKANVWGNQPTVRGDKTFARTAMSWSDGYGVLRGLIVPGTISEGSMHDYNPETLRLMNMDYKWLEAWHFYKSFCSYFKAASIPTGNIVGTIQDSRNKNQATYDKIYNSKDELLALNKARIILTPGNKIYETDEYNNGVYVFKDLAPGTYLLKYEAPGYYSQEQELIVKAGETTYKNVLLDMERSTPPVIVDYSPVGDFQTPVNCVSPVILNFNWDIDEESALQAISISPQIEGKFTFEDSNHRIIFTPTQPYMTSTTYTVTIDKSLKHRGGMSMGTDFIFSFFTQDRNRLKLLSSYPGEEMNKVHYSKQRLSFIFDWALNTAVVPDQVKVRDKEGKEVGQAIRSRLYNKYKEPLGSYSFQMIYDFTPGERYDIVIDENLTDQKGIPFFNVKTIPFEAVDMRVTDKPVAIDFETADLLRYEDGIGQNVVSASVGRSSTQKLFGSYGYEFKYAFEDKNTGELSYRFVNPVIELISRHCIGVHLYGELSGNELWLELGCEEEEVQIKLSDFRTTGWEYVETGLTDLATDKKYLLKGFKLIRKTNLFTDSGQFYLDNLLLSENTGDGILTTPNDLQIYPNPVTDCIYTNTKMQLQLFTLDGRLLKETFGDRLFVGSVSSGTYLLKCSSSGQAFHRTILIRH